LVFLRRVGLTSDRLPQRTAGPGGPRCRPRGAQRPRRARQAPDGAARRPGVCRGHHPVRPWRASARVRMCSNASGGSGLRFRTPGRCGAVASAWAPRHRGGP